MKIISMNVVVVMLMMDNDDDDKEGPSDKGYLGAHLLASVRASVGAVCSFHQVYKHPIRSNYVIRKK